MYVRLFYPVIMLVLLVITALATTVHSKHTSKDDDNSVYMPHTQDRQPGFGGTHGYQQGPPDYSQIGQQYQAQYAPPQQQQVDTSADGDSNTDTATSADTQQQYSDQYKDIGEQYKQQGKAIGEQYKNQYKGSEVKSQEDDIKKQQQAAGKQIGEEYKNAYKPADEDKPAPKHKPHHHHYTSKDSDKKSSGDKTTLIDSTMLHEHKHRNHAEKEVEEYQHTLRRLVKQHDRTNARIAELQHDIRRLRRSIETQEDELDKADSQLVKAEVDDTGRQSFNSGDEWSKFYKQYTKPYAKYWQNAQPGAGGQTYGQGGAPGGVTPDDTTHQTGETGPHHQPGRKDHDAPHHKAPHHHKHSDKHARTFTLPDIDDVDSSATDQSDAAIRQSAHDAVTQRHHNIAKDEYTPKSLALVDFTALSSAQLNDVDATAYLVNRQVLTNEKRMLQAIEHNLFEQQQLNEQQREREQDEIERLEEELERKYERMTDEKERQLERKQDKAERAYEKYKDKLSDVKDYKKDIKDRAKDLKDEAKDLHELKKHLLKQRKELCEWEDKLEHEQKKLDDKLDRAHSKVKQAEKEADKEHEKYKEVAADYKDEKSDVKDLEKKNDKLSDKVDDAKSEAKHEEKKADKLHDEVKAKSDKSHDRHKHDRHDSKSSKHDSKHESSKPKKSHGKHTLVELGAMFDSAPLDSLALVEAMYQQLTEETYQLAVESDMMLHQHNLHALTWFQWFALATVLVVGSGALLVLGNRLRSLYKQTSYEQITDYPLAQHV